MAFDLASKNKTCIAHPPEHFLSASSFNQPPHPLEKNRESIQMFRLRGKGGSRKSE